MTIHKVKFVNLAHQLVSHVRIIKTFAHNAFKNRIES